MTAEQLLKIIEPIEAIYINATAEIEIKLAEHFKSDKDKSLLDWQIAKSLESAQFQKEVNAIIQNNTKSLKVKTSAVFKEAITTQLEANEQVYKELDVLPLDESPAVNSVSENNQKDLLYKFGLISMMLLIYSNTTYQTFIQNVTQFEEVNKNFDLVREKAIREATKKLSKDSIPVFIDKAGRKWSAEAYINMITRTTLHNTAIEAERARAMELNCNTFQISSHTGARPLCEPYQGKFYSWLAGDSGTIQTGSGERIEYDSIYNTSYGEPAGIFGINCRHSPMTFISGFSTPKYEVIDKEENDKVYKLTQQQRQLERSVRQAKITNLMLEKNGTLQESDILKLKNKQRTYKEFCEENNRAVRPDRLQIFIKE